MFPEWQAETAGTAALREQLQHIYWIGGGSGAGKSTISRRIAAEHGLRVYPTDEVMDDHARRSTHEDSPLLHRFMAMDMDERWVNRSPKTLLETFHWFQGEGFNMIIEDLLCLPREPAVIVEGFRLLPRLVKPLLSLPAHAVWLVPTPAFREAVVESRGGSAWGFLARTTDPEKALVNLLERDRMFTDIILEETARLELNAIEVDATTTEDDLVKRVTEALGLADCVKPRKGTKSHKLKVIIRKATMEDREAIRQLIAESARQLSREHYSDAQIETAIATVFGVDTDLIEDGTYFVVESDGQLVGCGGWSKRKTLFGGDQYSSRDAGYLDPQSEPAKIRAFFIHPDHARKGIARAILTECETEARAQDFRALELMATLPGIEFYKSRGFTEMGNLDLELTEEVKLELVPMRKELL